MGGHRKNNCVRPRENEIDLYTGLPLAKEPEVAEKKSRHGKKKTEIEKEQAQLKKLIDSGVPAPGHEESNHQRTRNKGPKKKK